MENLAQQLRFQSAASDVDFSALLAGVRAIAPRCVECGVPLDFAMTGIRFRMTEAGDEGKLCRPCAVTEVGESLLSDLPK
jgi:hypothetical protein